MFYAKRMKEIRTNNNMMQKDIAKILNITSYDYSHFETEHTIIPLKHLINFCNYYNTSLDYIFGFTDVIHENTNNLEINLIKSGERLKNFRKENKITQSKLANIIKVSNTIISEYELGHLLMSTHTLYDICKKYNISADYLLGKTDSPKYLN